MSKLEQNLPQSEYKVPEFLSTNKAVWLAHEQLTAGCVTIQLPRSVSIKGHIVYTCVNVINVGLNRFALALGMYTPNGICTRPVNYEISVLRLGEYVMPTEQSSDFAEFAAQQIISNREVLISVKNDCVIGHGECANVKLVAKAMILNPRPKDRPDRDNPKPEPRPEDEKIRYFNDTLVANIKSCIEFALGITSQEALPEHP